MEITDVPRMEPHEENLLDLHSVLNVLNVVQGELSIIGLILSGNDDLLRKSLDVCGQYKNSLSEPESFREHAARLPDHEAAFFAEIEENLRRYSENAAHEDIAESMDNLRSVLRVFRIRLEEIKQREADAKQWQTLSIASLTERFHEVFEAIEKNARGRYHFRYNPAASMQKDYYIDFRINSPDGLHVRIPAVFQDVMRDLIANARKYTAPGGRISAGLDLTKTEIRFRVEDSGRGIPPDELTDVVRFGYRATNTRDVRTLGAGYGLTKAFWVTKRLQGRFFIGSRLGEGTAIHITLPIPPGERAHK